ncbi:hypothetical protein P9272_23905 [Mesorhizobium sp. WSM4976]|uniref:hypothetical protein n=1 Tax=Mesorhizobium sp. WSM4976 TaxID=3038549 RepID=UPI0024161C4E|nr:hypothetical protein [Mesorhizobium sp. WSM4976]MDG4896616.1 hypothetical protein [Mesorhizobium sp. WSM4976]
MTDSENNQDFIEVERRAFFETSNPMHAWAAFRYASVVGTEMPDWVRGYFDLVSKRMLALAADAQTEADRPKRNSKVDDFGPRLAAAMMMKGSHLTGYHSDWISYGMNVRHRVQAGDKETFAIESVAEDAGVSVSTVRRGWKRYNKLYPGDAVFPHEAVSKGT